MSRRIVLAPLVAFLALPLPVLAAGSVPDALVQKAFAKGRVRVVITMDAGWEPEGHLTASRATSQRLGLARRGDAVAAVLRSGGASLLRRFDRLPILVAEVSPAALAELAASPDVAAVHEDAAYPVTLSGSSPLVQADQAWAWQRTGASQTVAVLDTGIRASHTFFGGRVVGQACFSTTVSGVSSTNCPNGTDAQVGAGAAAACTYTGDCFHGTHVAGIAAGASTSFSGVGRGAGIYAIQVFSRFNNATDCSPAAAPCTFSYISDQIAALDHVFAKRGSHNFAAVNMSLGGGQFTSSCDSQPQKPAIDQLRSVGIATVIAAGNDGFRTALSSPGCISSAISVGSTTKTNVVSSFSNAASFMSLWAPGSSINSATSSGDTSFIIASGTSMAAPQVAGAWSLLKQHKPGASVAEVLSALDSTGASITDSRTGGAVTKRRISVLNALRALCTPQAIVRGTAPAGSLTTSDCRAWRRDAYADSYTFTGSAGEPIAFSLESGSFNAYLQLLDANGNVVAQDDNGAGGTNARIPAGGGFWTLPAGGSYTLQATAATTGGVGAYTLTFVPSTPTATPTATPTPTPSPTPFPTPAQPILVSPNGTITTATPTYTWNVTAGAVDYYLWVNRADTAVLQQWYIALTCASTCSVTPSTALPNGSYTWWIQARNVGGTGPWSGAMTFTVNVPSTPTPIAGPTATPTPTPTPRSRPAPPSTAANLISPNGGGTSTTPAYTWTPVTGATDYQLWVNTAAGTVAFQTWYNALACTSTCTVTPSASLANGSYTWWIQARNSAGQGPWSAGLSFDVSASATPTSTPTPTATPTPGSRPTPPASAATLVSPTGAVSSSTITYTWNPVPGAADYLLWVNNAGGTAVIQTWYNSLSCGTTCSVTPASTLTNGSYTWWIQARNGAGQGPWSSGMSFGVSPTTTARQGTPTLVAPSGTITTSTPTYTWNPVADATDYHLWVNGPAGTAVIQQWYNGLTCSTTCAATPSTSLAAGGSYTWWIQARNSAGTGPWSAARTFTR